MSELVTTMQGTHYDELIGGTAVTPIIKNVTITGVTKDTDLARGTLLALAPTTGKYSVLVKPTGTANDTMIAKAVLARDIHQDGSGDLVAPVYIAGIFNREKMIVPAEDTVEVHEEELRDAGIYLTSIQ
mgnify:CR=1 FL=1